MTRWYVWRIPDSTPYSKEEKAGNIGSGVQGCSEADRLESSGIAYCATTPLLVYAKSDVENVPLMVWHGRMERECRFRYCAPHLTMAQNYEVHSKIALDASNYF
ncbi:hypothetical protein AVEN_219793-1 [Araneus ventricosus]|uniref:Uncharacterized protein n=1 Tax=Araneus ventricosus TaxID=182803 RepID=A0A4Y2JYY9_ARAVE|nr:hypothetical protein AVEN_219793-1 [Araneus ventricosus]